MSSEEANSQTCLTWFSVVLISTSLHFCADKATAQNNQKRAVPFAEYGTEKMIYDVRMEPQALLYKGIILYGVELLVLKF